MSFPLAFGHRDDAGRPVSRFQMELRQAIYDIRRGPRADPAAASARERAMEAVFLDADVDERSKWGERTHLMMAATEGNVHQAKLLLELGADASLLSSRGQDPLCMALIHRPKTEIILMLARSGAPLDRSYALRRPALGQMTLRQLADRHLGSPERAAAIHALIEAEALRSASGPANAPPRIRSL